ncbi:MAG TPA: hypothetical protein HPP83_03055 [Candidatus Hydrogenedentes bacterium]|nr:hypothetical protein [Candidatus Hydrogenedentota bacterium]
MSGKREFHPQFVTDDKGHTTNVILPIDEYQELLEDLDDLAVVAERRDSPSVPHAQAKAELQKDGYLPD